MLPANRTDGPEAFLREANGRAEEQGDQDCRDAAVHNHSPAIGDGPPSNSLPSESMYAWLPSSFQWMCIAALLS